MIYREMHKLVAGVTPWLLTISGHEIGQKKAKLLIQVG